MLRVLLWLEGRLELEHKNWMLDFRPHYSQALRGYVVLLVWPVSGCVLCILTSSLKVTVEDWHAVKIIGTVTFCDEPEPEGTSEFLPTLPKLDIQFNELPGPTPGSSLFRQYRCPTGGIVSQHSKGALHGEGYLLPNLEVEEARSGGGKWNTSRLSVGVVG